MSRRPLHARGRSVSLQTRRAVGLLAAVAMVASAWGKPAPGPGVSATPSATPAPARRRTSGSPSTASPPSSRRRAATRPLYGSRLIYTGLYRANPPAPRSTSRVSSGRATGSRSWTPSGSTS